MRPGLRIILLAVLAAAGASASPAAARSPVEDALPCNHVDVLDALETGIAAEILAQGWATGTAKAIDDRLQTFQFTDLGYDQDRALRTCRAQYELFLGPEPSSYLATYEVPVLSAPDTKPTPRLVSLKQLAALPACDAEPVVALLRKDMLDEVPDDIIAASGADAVIAAMQFSALNPLDFEWESQTRMCSATMTLAIGGTTVFGLRRLTFTITWEDRDKATLAVHGFLN